MSLCGTVRKTCGTVGRQQDWFVELVMPKAVIETAAPNEVARLTRLMARGNEEAYREFFRLYFHRLLAYLVVVARGNEDQARELVQQTMVKVAKHIRVFEEEAVLWRWLTLLARTTAVDEGRKRERHFSFLSRWWTAQQERPMENSEDEGVFEEMLVMGLERLEEDERRVLEQKYFEDRSVREMAVDLGMTEKAVESRLSRGRARLKEIVLGGLSDE